MQRLVGAVSALIALAFTVEPLAMHDCPVHRATAEQTATDPSRHSGMHHGMSAGLADAADRESGGSHTPDSRTNCCCPDGGCVSIPVALIARSAVLVDGESAQPSRVAPRTPSRLPVPRVDLALPMAHGPPIV